MTQSKKKTYKVGDLYELPEQPVDVVYPDGSRYRCSTGLYLDRVGTFLIDGTEVEVA